MCFTRCFTRWFSSKLVIEKLDKEKSYKSSFTSKNDKMKSIIDSTPDDVLLDFWNFADMFETDFIKKYQNPRGIGIMDVNQVGRLQPIWNEYMKRKRKNFIDKHTNYSKEFMKGKDTVYGISYEKYTIENVTLIDGLFYDKRLEKETCTISKYCGTQYSCANPNPNTQISHQLSETHRKKMFEISLIKNIEKIMWKSFLAKKEYDEFKERVRVQYERELKERKEKEQAKMRLLGIDEKEIERESYKQYLVKKRTEEMLKRNKKYM